jgi:diaminopimelate decarboxylase
LATWVRRQGVTVDVTSAVDLAGAMAEGIDPMHIVIHAHDGATASVRRAVSTGAARFVVGSSRQIAGLAESADRVQRVVIDTTAMDALTSEVLAQRGLELIGLHRRLDDPDDAIGMVALREMIAQMARIRRKHGVLLSRVSLAGLDVGERCLEPRILRRIAEAMNEVIGDACARHAFPRPGLTVSPTRSVLLPA